MANKIKARMIDQGLGYDDLKKETDLTIKRLKKIIDEDDVADHWEAGRIAGALCCEPTDIFTTDGAGSWTCRHRGGPL
jgi:hypothetical protein